MSGSQLLLLGGTPQVASDPNFEYTTLLLPGNGTNGAQNNTFLDSSTNNFTITRNGNTTQGTFSPFSQTGWGNYFDGSGDYLTVADNAALQMGSGDFTIEYWWYPNNITSYQNPIDKGYTGAGGLLLQTGNGDGRIIVYASGSTVITSSTSVTVNAWNHMALVRSGTTLTLYQNGVSVGSATNSTNFNNTTQLGIGATGSPVVGSFPVVGYLSNVRFVKGTAVYSGSTYTVPTAPLTAITNTSLLTCQSNRFRDASTNNFTITRNGDVSVQAFSPFNPTAAWSASTNGGSGYFDGSGDYLSAPSNAAFALPGDFTFEAWIYPTSWAATFVPVFTVFLSPTGGFWVGKNSSNFVLRAAGVADQLTTTTFPTLNTWTHLAVVRSGTTATIYYNGVSIVSGTVTYSFGQEQANIASDTSGNNFPGYISSLRLVKGTAVYTAAFTPPTAPLTAITNTSLLLNYTNAGIYDATSKNDLETVGNAQISTTQSKFGGSSMAFDGSGDRLFEPSNQNYNFGTGDFTIELWAYPTSQGGHGSSNNDCFIDFRPGANGVYGTLYIFNNGTGVYWFVNSANRITGGAISNGTWTHIAIARASGSTKLFINGTQSGSTYADTNNYLVSPIMIGEFNDGTGGGNFQGYIDDLRVTKGIARYTSNFTPPTAAFLTL